MPYCIIMATQKCPKCRSRRIRQGYRPTHLLMKLIFRYNLLCDECNWEFNGFAIPGTVGRKTRKKKSTSEPNNLKDTQGKYNQDNDILEADELTEEPDEENKSLKPPEIEQIPQLVKINDFQKEKVKVKKKVRVKLH